MCVGMNPVISLHTSPEMGEEGEGPVTPGKGVVGVGTPWVRWSPEGATT